MKNKTTIDDDLRRELLAVNPLWQDILKSLSLGLSERVVANCCGVKIKTLRKHMELMRDLGYSVEVAK